MPTLDIESTELQGIPDGVYVRLEGTLDGGTMPQLEDVLKGIAAQKVRRILVDVQELLYINRSAFMFLVGFSKDLERTGGGLVLCGPNPTLKRMFEMLGLGAFLPVVGSVQEGRQRLVEGVPGNQAEASPSREELELPVGDTQRGVDFDAALRGLSEGREPSLDDVGAAPTPAAGEGDDLLVAEPDEAAERPTHAESDEPSGPPPARFPVIQVCAYCSANLEIESPGRYRCPRCHAFLLVQNDGKVEYLESQVPRPVRMELVSSKECTRGLMDFLAAVAKPLLTDPSDLAKLQRAVSSVCRHVRETAYEGNGGRTYEALIAVEKDQIVVEFADSGTRVEPAAVMAEIRPLVDTAEVKGRLGGGNFYKLVKRPRPVETKP